MFMKIDETFKREGMEMPKMITDFLKLTEWRQKRAELHQEVIVELRNEAAKEYNVLLEEEKQLRAEITELCKRYQELTHKIAMDGEINKPEHRRLELCSSQDGEKDMKT